MGVCQWCVCVELNRAVRIIALATIFIVAHQQKAVSLLYFLFSFFLSLDEEVMGEGDI